MKSVIQSLFYTALLFATVACSNFGGGSSDSAAATSSDALSVSAASTTIALSATTTIYVSGGSGSYVSSTASEGSLYLSSSGVYQYTAPSSSSNPYAQISIVDSDGNVGSVYIYFGSSSGTLNIVAYSTTLSLGASTSITVSGGTGSYVSAAASQGTIVQSNSNSYVYTAPSSSATATTTITIKDSSGSVGYAYITISGASSSAYQCGGTYDASIGGIGAVIYLVGDTQGYVSGFIYMTNYYYPVFGTCTISGSNGTVSFKNLSLNHSYSGTLAFNSSNQILFSGTVTTSGSSYSWSAKSRSAVSSTSWPSYSCEGNYNATIAGNTGTLVLVQNGSNYVAGYLYLQGYYYVIAGTCNGSSGSVSLNNYTTGSTYTGSVGFSNSTITLSGTFSLTSGTTYSWSAVSY